MQNNDWECMVKGDKNAFLKIYQDHYTSLFQYGFRLTFNKELTKDCIQEVFLEVWNTRSTVKKEVVNVRSYLYTWLRRKISRAISRIDRDRSGEEEASIFDPVEVSYEELLIAFQQTAEKKEIVRRALEKLTRKQIEIIRLKFFENLSYSEIAHKRSLTTRTVYNIVYEAIHTLREDKSLVLEK